VSEPGEYEERAAPEVEDVDRVSATIVAADGTWQPGRPGVYGAVTWRPDLARDDPHSVLHVHLADRLRPYLVDRLRAAATAGHEVHVAMPLAQLYVEEVLDTLTELDAQIHAIDRDAVSKPLPVLTALAERSIRVSTLSRQRLANLALALSRLAGSAPLRGRRFEALVLFLLSQVRDFRVVEHNYRTDTEELDGVIQQGATQGRVWATLAAPFLLLEAKNWSRRVDQQVVSVLRVKMLGRRGSVRIALLCASSGFTSDAREQELRFASDNLTIVFIGPEEIDAWVRATDPDEFLEATIRRDMLR
jgi:restriction endonuclease